jgi:gephyrin
MLAAAVAAAGGEVVDFGIAADDAEELARRVRQGLHGADVLVTSGGVSMGELDLIKPLLMQNATVHFGRLRMKPGKPCTFATTQVDGRRRLVFALPGNPVSSLVTFHLLVTPALRRLAGWTHPELTRLMAVLSQPLELDPARPEYHRAVLAWDGTLDEGRGGFVASSTGSQASSRLLSMRTANALLEIPEGQGTLAAGARVTALLIGEL